MGCLGQIFVLAGIANDSARLRRCGYLYGYFDGDLIGSATLRYRYSA